MNKWYKGALCVAMVCLLFPVPAKTVQAREKNTILPGIFIEDMSMEGKTVEEAEGEVNAYVEGLLSRQITLTAVNGNEVTITPADVGFTWNNRDVVKEAAAIGKKGNIVERYKAEKDLQFENKIFSLSFDADKELIRHVLADQCSVYNLEAQNATLALPISLPADISREDAIAAGKEAIKDKLTGNIVKEIYVPGRIVNIVMK